MHLTIAPVQYEVHKLEQEMREARRRHRRSLADLRARACAALAPAYRPPVLRLAGMLGLF